MIPGQFEEHRAELLGLAYRMLGDMGRAEDIVQETWLRCERSAADVEAPLPYLLRIATRLCLDELGSARARREESRGDRLPEPINLDDRGLGRVEIVDRVSMAFLVVLQRLTPAERAVLLLHDMFDFEHVEIAKLLGKSEAACRQLLRRAKENVASGRRVLDTSPEQHRRLLTVFLRAAMQGDVEGLTDLLVEDAVLVADAGPHGARYGKARNLPGPLRGARKIAAFVAAVTPEGSKEVTRHLCELNGQPALLAWRDGRPFCAILLAVADGRIQQIFMQLDPARLRHLGSSGFFIA